MSAPVTHDPVAVTTADGTSWVRRAVTRDGRGLYAVDGSCKCPEFLLVPLSELAVHGIQGMADALPMPVPVVPEPQVSELEHLRKERDAFRDQRNAVFATNERLLVEVQESDQARLRAENETRTVRREADELKARVAELEAERKKYVGREPTIAEEMAYLSRCFHAVGDLTLPESLKVDSIDPQYRNGYVHALADMRAALESPERTPYPPALPWAALMDDEDRAEFLDELAESATTHASSDVALAEVENTCATWRLIAEAQHGHNTAPGPDAMTQVYMPVASLREPEGEFYGFLHREGRVSHDLPETGGAK